MAIPDWDAGVDLQSTQLGISHLNCLLHCPTVATDLIIHHHVSMSNQALAPLPMSGGVGGVGWGCQVGGGGGSGGGGVGGGSGGGKGGGGVRWFGGRWRRCQVGVSGGRGCRVGGGGGGRTGGVGGWLGGGGC